MKQSCFVACYDMFIKSHIIVGIKAVNPEMEIIEITSKNELINQLRCFSNITIYFDKFFLGYILKYKIAGIKFLNPEANIVFVEQGECPVHFGLRLHSLGVTGFICNSENLTFNNDAFRLTLNGIKYFPDEVVNILINSEQTIDKKNFSEITITELLIGLYAGSGKSYKEICSELSNMAIGTVGLHISRLRKKIGYKNKEDFITLNKITFNDFNEQNKIIKFL